MNDYLMQHLESLKQLIPLAVDTLSELAAGAEKDSVRLAAAESILDRTGLGRGTTHTVQTSKEEHDQATQAALELAAKLERNKQLSAGTPTPSLDTLVVLEGETTESEELVPVPLSH